MNLQTNVESIIRRLENITNTTATLEDDKYIFKPNPIRPIKNIYRRKSLKSAADLDNYNSILITITSSRIEEISELLSKKRFSNENESDKYEFYDSNYYEVLLTRGGRKLLRKVNYPLIIEDESNKITYKISPVSDEYLLGILINESPKYYTSLSIGKSNSFSNKHLAKQGIYEVNIFDFLRAESSLLITLKIEIDKKHKYSLKDFENFTYTFLFQLAYNTDLRFYPKTYLKETNSIERTSSVNELDPPRRLYNNDLIQHYLLAVSTKNPVVIFLSHYHVIEHFFDSVFYKDLNREIHKMITNTGFSYNRESDINKLIIKIKNSLPIKLSEDLTFKELEALKICLKKYVSIQDLVTAINQFDSNLLNYYISTKVPFSGGDSVNFKNADEKNICASLANRIYKTRNALVHSKEGISKEAEKNRYTPFVDDHVLFKEIPLMQLISEQIILSTSDEFKI